VSGVRHAIRSLWNAKAFSAVAVATIALGIGADTAVFSVVDAVLLRPLPFADADRIVTLTHLNSVRAIRGFVFEVSPSDPATCVAVILVFTLTAIAAAILPVRRALRVDPLIALRTE